VYDTVQYSKGDEIDIMDTTETIEETEQMGARHDAAHQGRALDASRDVAICQATLDLLTEIGYDNLTMDAVAARAHASKATIYRRWPGKAALVVDALHRSKGSMADPDTGSLIGDLEAMSEGFCSPENSFNAKIMLGLITALAHDAEIRDVFRERLIEPRMNAMRTLFERAVERGEVSRDCNLDLLGSLLPALLIQEVLITGELPDAEFITQVRRDVILPLATASK
jgi:AcrR family transcriptional regulator